MSKRAITGLPTQRDLREQAKSRATFNVKPAKSIRLIKRESGNASVSVTSDAVLTAKASSDVLSNFERRHIESNVQSWIQGTNDAKAAVMAEFNQLFGGTK